MAGTVMDRLETLEQRLGEVERCCQGVRADVNILLSAMVRGDQPKRRRRKHNSGPVQIINKPEEE